MQLNQGLFAFILRFVIIIPFFKHIVNINLCICCKVLILLAILEHGYTYRNIDDCRLNRCYKRAEVAKNYYLPLFLLPKQGEKLIFKAKYSIFSYEKAFLGVSRETILENR